MISSVDKLCNFFRTAGLPQYGQLGHGTDNEVCVKLLFRHIWIVSIHIRERDLHQERKRFWLSKLESSKS